MVIPSESEFLELIVETLNLDSDVEITPDTPLFDGKLELTSIDALEIGAVIGEHYEVELKPDEEKTRKSFFNIRSLYALVTEKMRERMEEPAAHAS